MKYTKELHERVRQNLRMFDYPHFDDGDIDALLDEIDRLEAELEKHRWIPVSEQRPPEQDIVLCYAPEYQSTEIRRTDLIGRAVSHWMPLPEPPKEEEC